MLGIGGATCITDNLLARLASVGLIVLAPSPVACEGPEPGITDILFADEGVVVPLPLIFPGDRPVKEADRECSGVLVLTDKCV